MPLAKAFGAGRRGDRRWKPRQLPDGGGPVRRSLVRRRISGLLSVVLWSRLPRRSLDEGGQLAAGRATQRLPPADCSVLYVNHV
jgi:hypothetical protein